MHNVQKRMIMDVETDRSRDIVMPRVDDQEEAQMMDKADEIEQWEAELMMITDQKTERW